MTLFDKMVADVRQNGSVAEDNVLHEVMQQIALAGLSRGGFFEKAAFYGGTCLHLLHDMPRYSEDSVSRSRSRWTSIRRRSSTRR